MVTGEGRADGTPSGQDHFKRPAQSTVVMRRGGERGEWEERGLSPTSLEPQRRQSLSMSGSAYSVESGGERGRLATLLC